MGVKKTSFISLGGHAKIIANALHSKAKMTGNIDLSKRTFLSRTVALSLSLAAKRVFARGETPNSLPVRVKDVNTTSIRDAVSLGCRTMSNVFNRDDHDIPFFTSEVWPKAELGFYKYHSEAHVPGRHLNALLNAEDALGIRVDETVIDKHAQAAFFSYSGPVPFPLNRRTIGGKLEIFHPHNLREGFHALYALVKYRKSERARELAEQSIAAIQKYWKPDAGWDRNYLANTLGLEVVDAPFILGIARALGPLVKYYRATQYKPALELATILKEKAVTEYFTTSGEFDAKRFSAHVHSTTCVMSSLAQFADLTRDSTVMERVQIFFAHGLKQISDEVGWASETAGEPVPDQGEVNDTGDILETALLLGQRVNSAYFQRAERILRCHLLPSQLRDISWIVDSPNPKGEDGKRDIANRHLGAFGFPAPYGHKPVGADSISFNMDIVGGAVGSLCEAWRSATKFDESGHRVDLWMDCESPAIKIHSPYDGGTLKITLRKPGPLAIRMPDWLSPRDATSDMIKPPQQFQNGYLAIDKPPVDKEIRIRVPLKQSRIALNHRTHQIAVALEGDSISAMQNFGTPLTYFDPLS
jgi:hypothetical protein